MSIGTANEYMLFKAVSLGVIDRYCASDSFIFKRLDCILLFQRVEVKYLHLAIWTIHEEELLPPVLNLKLRYDKTDVLGHLVNKLHLNLPPDFFAFISHYELRNLLVTHISRSVDFGCQLLDLADTVLVRGVWTGLDECQIPTHVLKDTKPWLGWVSVPRNLQWSILKSNH